MIAFVQIVSHKGFIYRLTIYTDHLVERKKQIRFIHRHTSTATLYMTANITIQKSDSSKDIIRSRFSSTELKVQIAMNAEVTNKLRSPQ